MKSQSRHHMADDFNLELQFAELGFDYKILLKAAKFINDWTVVLTAHDVYKYVGNRPEKLLFIFTLVQLEHDQEFEICNIQAFLFTWLVNSKRTRLVISKEYWNTPFPTKDGICVDIDLLRPINAGRENPWSFKSHLCKFLLLDYFADDSYLN